MDEDVKRQSGRKHTCGFIQGTVHHIASSKEVGNHLHVGIWKEQRFSFREGIAVGFSGSNNLSLSMTFLNRESYI